MFFGPEVHKQDKKKLKKVCDTQHFIRHPDTYTAVP
jgi:hypothetical protein